MTERNPLSSDPVVKNWRVLYTAALFEGDKQKLAERIVQAERVLIRRARELFVTTNNIEEEQAIDEALYALHLLRDCSAREYEENPHAHQDQPVERTLPPSCG
jgi:hypothetical protein